ncbi:MAG: VCBS repeat-containing protein, partial [Bacteroidota bacterium]
NFTKMLPQQKLTNYFFRNKGDLSFENVSYTWADSIPNFSNGAAYTDLDNDGDLDVVINNINDPASILRNNSIESAKGNYLKVQLTGADQNKMGVGARVKLYLTNGQILTRQLINSRGFLSAVSNTLHFGLATNEAVKLEVIWTDGKRQILENVTPNQVLRLKYADASESTNQQPAAANLFRPVNFDYRHIDPPYNDYQQQILLPHKLSQTGPALAKADVNGDGLADFYMGGGHTQAGVLFLANASGGFRMLTLPAFEKDKRKEDVAACFFDADKDGDQDLYVLSGSYEFQPNTKMLLDRLYLNDGTGRFDKTTDRIPDIAMAGAVVKAADVDQDGDQDLFVGNRVIPGIYPFPPDSYLLINEGGRFRADASGFEKLGLVTDAVWNDLDRDGDQDLILTGEWMGIEVFENEGGQLSKSEQYANLADAKGWWNELLVVDIDKDGDQDIIAGNLGLNSKFHATPKKPFHVYTKDFDYNGTADVILAKYYKGEEVPVRGKTCTAQQIPHLAQKIPTYNDFASRDLEGILGPSIETALHYEATEFRSGIFKNEGGAFQFEPFPNEVQQAPLNSILCEDFDMDGQLDLLLAGNNYLPEIETTRYDAGTGNYLKGQGDGQFRLISHLQSGFFAHQDVRDMLRVGKYIVVANNNDEAKLFEIGSASPANTQGLEQ